ncbi:MAG: hypothetical protein V7756_11805 [Halopseudomonas sp.]|uniref:hypothetical protein n=1 Tax=Halopseudomonas sp. TaxID=2901191 RepID=UPI003003A182
MKSTFTRLVLATPLVFGAATAAHADSNFAGLTWGQTSNNIQKSSALNANLNHPNFDSVINNERTWGVRAGQQTDTGRYYATYEYISGSNKGLKLRQQNFLGSYDVFYPLNETGTQLFGGGTLGLVKFEQNSSGISRDSNISYAAGLQAGLLQDVNQSVSLEGGYRYLRSNASTDFAPHGESSLGSLDLHSSGQWYLGANYKF